MHAVQHHHITKDILAGVIMTMLLILGAVTALLVPLPILYYRIKLGRKNSLIIPAVIMLMLVFLSRGAASGLLVFSGWMFLGFLLGECFELRLSIEKTILFSSIAVFISGCSVLLFYSNVSQSGIYELASGQMKLFMSYLMDAGLIEDAPDQLVHMVTCMLPGIIAATILFVSWLNVILAMPILKRNHLAVPDFGSLDLWKAPEYFVWVVIGGVFGLIVQLEPVFLFSMNVMIVMVLLYFFQGISIVSFFVKKTKIPVGLRALLYWLIFFQFPVNLMVTGVGFFDMWANFRTRSLKKSGNTDE
ncbi:MAG: YybS family protein [Proteobacteria bacterium]|nr:YybS family protein [Pseudomonadota bacterium]